jgi:rhodanese-related sulfurtransferase
LATKDPREPFTRISVSEAKEKLDKGEAVMVDVREPDEYVEVHAKGVRLIPVNTVISEVKQIRDYADGKEVLFICKSGARSALAAEFATAGGLDELPLFNVEGGTMAWTAAGLPTGD